MQVEIVSLNSKADYISEALSVDSADFDCQSMLVYEVKETATSVWANEATMVANSQAMYHAD